MHLPCGNVTIALDNGNGDISFVSHAHSDHLIGVRRKEKIIASEETIALANLKGKRTSIPNTKLLNAGHILGARQIAVEEDGRKTVYTGDICLHDNLITKGGEIEQCDKLIIEATYASHEYKFPKYEEVCDDIAKAIIENYEKNKVNILIGCYELGKAQELIKLLNDYCNIAPLVNEKTYEFSSVYEQFGTKLDHVLIGSDEAEEIMKGPFVALVPMRNAKRYFAHRLAEAFNRDTLVFIATGWALHYGFNVDRAFPLSDHADFYDLKHYIEQSGAKEVEFFSGDGNALRVSMGFAKPATTLPTLSF